MTDPGSITVTTVDSRTVVRLAGEIDISLQDEVSRALARIALGGLPVTLDLSRVSLLGTTGIAFLVQCERLCRESGAGCVVLGLPQQVRLVLGGLGLDTVLRLQGTGDVVDQHRECGRSVDA